MRPKILLLFEYGTLNGGEFSLLAMLESLGQTDFDFVAAAPKSGKLTDRLERLGIPVFPLTLIDTQGQKRSIKQINAHLSELMAHVSPDLVHANSLAMGRILGRIAPQVSVPCTSHLRDIIKLNRTVVADLNQNTGLIAVSKATRAFHVDQHDAYVFLFGEPPVHHPDGEKVVEHRLVGPAHPKQVPQDVDYQFGVGLVFRQKIVHEVLVV